MKFSDINFPLLFNDIPKFEKQNTISVNCFGFEKQVYSLPISREKYEKHVELLYITDISVDAVFMHLAKEDLLNINK